MTDISQILNTLMAQAFTACKLEATHATVTASGRPELADYQCNGAMALAKSLQKNPRAIAEDLITALKALPEATHIFEDISIAGPGFINLKLASSFLEQHALRLFKSEKLGVQPLHNPEKIVIDHGGPNLGKPMHVGHLRTAIIGEAIKNILRFEGHTVLGDVHFGDWGMPMGMIVYQIEKEHPDLPFFEKNRTEFPQEALFTIDEIGAFYKKATAIGKENEAERQKMRRVAAALQEGHLGYIALFECLRKVSFEAAKANFERLNVYFDLWRGEYTVRHMLDPMRDALLKKGLAKKDDGAIIFPFPEDEKMPPIILEKSDGGYTYGATDIATIQMRVEEDHFTKAIYVVDRRQSQHFDQVFKASAEAGYAQGLEMQFAPVGTVNDLDGKPLKSREGSPLTLKGMLDEAAQKARENLPDPSDEISAEELTALAEDIGIATVKFQDLHNNRNTDYIFDLERFSRFEGKTGPYLQYSVARINALFKKAGFEDAKGFNLVLTHPAERALLLSIAQFAQNLARAAERLEPSVICEQVFNVAQKFSSFYEACPILAESVSQAEKESRLLLADLTRKHQKICLKLLGIASPERLLKRG